MAVRGDRYFVDTLHFLAQRAEEFAVFLGHAVTHGIGNIHGGCPRGNRRLDHLAKKPNVGAGGILGRKFNVGAQ